MTDVSPYAPPKSALVDADASRVNSYKRYAVFQAEADWPSRCYKCNAATENRKKLKVTYINPWIYLSILITPIVTIVLALIFQKKFTIELPICDRHLRRRRNFLILQWSLVTLFVVLIAVAVVADWPEAVSLAVLVFLVLVLTALVGRMVYVAKFKKGNLWMRGPGRVFLESLPTFVS